MLLASEHMMWKCGEFVPPGLCINPTNMVAMETPNLFYDVSESQKAKQYY